MIQSVSIQNFLSFKDEVTFSFEATKDKKLEDYHVVEVAEGIKLLKIGVVYGANASGKSNLLAAIDFLKEFWFAITTSKDEETGTVPFLFDANTQNKPSKFKLIFFSEGLKFVYTLEVTTHKVLSEKLDFYPGTQPANIFEKHLNSYNNISEIIFGPKIKVNSVAKEEIALKCLPNMSFFAAYGQVNTNIPAVETAIKWMGNQFMNTVQPKTKLSLHVEQLIYKDSHLKEDMLSYMQEADFNISNINVDVEKEDASDMYLSDLPTLNIAMEGIAPYKRKRSVNITKTTFEYKVVNEDKSESYFPLPIGKQSEGTLRLFGLSGIILTAIKKNAFLAIDEIESKLHPRLVEYILERFLKESTQAQLLVATHYDGLLEEDDLLRKDNVWFTEKREDASTSLYSLSDFKAVNRITSLQKAYKYGKFGAIPNI